MKKNLTEEDIDDIQQRFKNAENLFKFIVENVDLDSDTRDKILEYLRYEDYVKNLY